MPHSPNRLLASLSTRDYRRLQPMLRTLEVKAETSLPFCGHTRVYFPGTSLCSIISSMGNGEDIEVACVGSEGAVGLSSLAGACPNGRNGFVQVADGTVQYLPSVLFEGQLVANEQLRDLVDGFCHSFLETMIQSVACNRLHTPEERCARWLLAVHDRLWRVRFELKVRFLARAMGLRNAEAGSIISRFEVDGILRYDGSSITILDSNALRRRACRCYDALKRGYTLAHPIRPPAKTKTVKESARVIPMRGVSGACTLCGSSTRVPHKTGHECILALDQEIATLVRRTHTLRKYRAQLVANRAQLYRDILKRSSGLV